MKFHSFYNSGYFAILVLVALTFCNRKSEYVVLSDGEMGGILAATCGKVCKTDPHERCNVYKRRVKDKDPCLGQVYSGCEASVGMVEYGGKCDSNVYGSFCTSRGAKKTDECEAHKEGNSCGHVMKNEKCKFTPDDPSTKPVWDPKLGRKVWAGKCQGKNPKKISCAGVDNESCM